MTITKWNANVNGIRSVVNNEKNLYLRKKTLIFHTEQNIFTYIQQRCKGEINISDKRAGGLFTEDGALYTNAIYHFDK